MPLFKKKHTHRINFKKYNFSKYVKPRRYNIKIKSRNIFSSSPSPSLFFKKLTDNKRLYLSSYLINFLYNKTNLEQGTFNNKEGLNIYITRNSIYNLYTSNFYTNHTNHSTKLKSLMQENKLLTPTTFFKQNVKISNVTNTKKIFVKTLLNSNVDHAYFGNLYSILTSFNYFNRTTKKHLLHSKKAAIIIALIDLESSLSTNPVYLTSSQDVALLFLIKQSKIESSKSYSNALLYKHNKSLLFLPKNKFVVKQANTYNSTVVPMIKLLTVFSSSLFLLQKKNIVFLGWKKINSTIKIKKNILRKNSALKRTIRLVLFGSKLFRRKNFNKNIFKKKIYSKKMLRHSRELQDVFWYNKRKFDWKFRKQRRSFFLNLQRINKSQRKKLRLSWEASAQDFTHIDYTSNLKIEQNLLKVDRNSNIYYTKHNKYSLLNKQLLLVSKQNNIYQLTLLMLNPFILKMLTINHLKNADNILTGFSQKIHVLLRKVVNNPLHLDFLKYSNVLPTKTFNKVLVKQLSSLYSMNKIREDIIPFYYHTLIRFIEHCSGKKILFQFYPFIHQNITYDFIVRYKSWIPRMGSYERRLGHKFFFEEALHIMHLSFTLRDAVLFSNWMKSMILRISFWKTRSIFRFLRYLYLLYFTPTFSELKIRGLKIKLKGKISAAGNSRKRTILYRTGETSHSTVDLRVSYHNQVINTFTGVMGFQVWIFY